MSLLTRIARLPSRASDAFGLTRFRYRRRLWRLVPIHRNFGFFAGTPVDRHYIECFLRRHQTDVRGRVLEIADNAYTRQFGGDRVTQSDILSATDEGTTRPTIVGNLATGEGVPVAQYDAIILTQTLHLIYDIRAALRHAHRALKPGGTLLATLPGISQISRYDMDRWGDYWRVTSLSTRRLACEYFDPDRVTVESYGNVLSATAFLHGIPLGFLKPRELDLQDPDYEVIIGLHARVA